MRILNLQLSALLALVLGVALASPVVADPISGSLDGFLRESARATPAELDSLARRFNPYQLPLLAAALSAEERASGEFSTLPYQAMVKWQYWLGRELDPQNRGFWGVNHPRRDPSGRVDAAIASLELLQLQALTEMAVRRGHAVDALIWWQDHRSLRQRLARSLYDPVLGAYSNLDSLGHQTEPAGSWPGLLPIAMGAPMVPDATTAFARAALLGDRPEDDPLASVEAMAALDPSAGWVLRRGPDRLAADTLLRLVGRVFERMGDPGLRRVAREAQRALGLDPHAPLRLHFGNASLDVPDDALDPWPLTGARAGVDLFRRLRFAPEREVARARTALSQLTSSDMPDSTAELLAASVAAWRKGPYKAQRSSLMRNHREVLAPNGDPAGAAFHFRDGDGETMAKAAVSAMLEDLLRHHLRPMPQSPYRAELNPPTLGAGMSPELTVVFPREAEAVGAADGEWTAAWTNGRTIRRSEPLTLAPVDSRTFRAPVGAPPSDLDIWWLIVRGPDGGPRQAPGLAVVESIRTSLAALGPPQADGTIAYELRINNRVDRTASGRVEISHPEAWEIQPSPQFSFDLAPYGLQRWTVHLHPGDGLGPSTSMTEWRVFEGQQMVERMSVPIAVPLRWLSIGPFSYPEDDPLSRRHELETEPDVAGRYRGLSGVVGWRHFSAGALQPEGWVRMVDSGQPRGIHYAMTALTTSSRDVVVSLESSSPCVLLIDGREEVRMDAFKRNRQQMIRLHNGANRIAVKMFAGKGEEGRFRLRLEDAGGGPMAAVENGLEQLLDGYAYVKGSPEAEMSPEAQQRQLYRRVPIKFVDSNALAVSVVGSFNGWSPTAHPMIKDESGQWVVEIPLRPGRFEYKLAVDGVNWIADPDNPIQTADGFGGINSVLVLD